MSKKQKFGVVSSAGKAAYTFKTSEHAEVVVGDPDKAEFTPKLSLHKWNRECSLHIMVLPETGQPKSAQKQVAQDTQQIASLDKNQIKHSIGAVDYKFYPLDPSEQMEDGGVEFEFTLNEKPSSNIFTFPISTKNLVFHYQPELTPEQKASGRFIQPDNVIGSYAVYHARRSNMHRTDELAEKYKTGKAFHIYRPKVTDAKGDSVWADLNIGTDASVLTVTVPQDFLDNAKYPVTVDPTFGYTSIGSSFGITVDANDIIAGVYTTPSGASNSAQKITVALTNLPISHAKCGFYKDSDGSFLQGTVERTSIPSSGSPKWYVFQFSPGYTLPDATVVDMSFWTDTGDCILAADSIGGTIKWTNQAYGSWPNPISFNHTIPSYKASIYCSYLASGNWALTISTLHGATSPTVGVHYYSPGSNVPVTVTPLDSNHVLDHWLLDGVNVGNANPYTVAMNDDHTLQAVLFAATLGVQLTDCVAAPTWATPAHSSDMFYFGALLGKYAISDLETEIAYQNALATTAGYLAALRIAMIAKVRGLSSSPLVAAQKTAMSALTFFTNKHWPVTGTFNAGPHGSGDCCLLGYYGFSNEFQLANLLNYDVAQWNCHLAWQELVAVCAAAGNKGILEMDPSTLEYYIFDEGRFYDENALTINLLVELYKLDPDNNASALTYALALWDYLNANYWNLAAAPNGFSYMPSIMPGWECEGGFFQQVIMKLYAANGYTLANFAHLTTDLHSRYLASGWDSPQWTWSDGTRGYSSIHHHTVTNQWRLQNTLGAWVSLHAFYQVMSATDKAAIVALLNAATPAWKHLILDSTLFDPSTDKFKMASDGSASDGATAMGTALLFLEGIVPDTGSLYIPLIHNDYEDTYTLNKYFRLDVANHKIRIPVAKGNLIFLYGAVPLTVAFSEDGVYDVTFSPDWSQLSGKTKVMNLDPRLLYAAQPSLAGLAGGTSVYQHFKQTIQKRGEAVTWQTLFIEDIVDDETGWNVKSFQESTVSIWFHPQAASELEFRFGFIPREDLLAATQENILEGDRIRDARGTTYLVKTVRDYYHQGNFIVRFLGMALLPMVI